MGNLRIIHVVILLAVHFIETAIVLRYREIKKNSNTFSRVIKGSLNTVRINNLVPTADIRSVASRFTTKAIPGYLHRPYTYLLL